MIPNSADFLVVFLTVVVVAVMYTGRRRTSTNRGLPLPPGPTPLPLLGNLLNMPNKNEWIVYRDWCRKYNSDLVYVKTLGQDIVVLNSAKAATELLEKRSSIYSDRPAFTALTDMFGFTWLTPTIPYGTTWRKQRKTYQTTMNASSMKKYQPLEIKATHRLLRNVLQDPDAFEHHLRHLAGQVILSIAYGIDIQPSGDKWVELAEHAMTAFALGTQFGGLVFDMVPFLRYMPWWFPGAGLKKDASKYAKLIVDVLEKPYAETEAAVARGDAPPSMAASIIMEQSALPDSEKDRVSAQAVPATSYLGAADTTISSFMTFLLAMLLYPDAQKRAQAEIDAVVGTTRLPEFADEESLPYVNALVKEVQRWHPVVPLTTPHRLVQDDVYEGFFIPGGTTVIGNAWAILHDDEEYGPDPETFKPERFLGQDAKFPDEIFGFGRRICPGRFMARSSVWIAIVNLLAVFDFTHAIDEHGRKVEVTEEYTSGLISYPQPFGFSITPRSEAARRLVMSLSGEEVEEAEGEN